MKNLLTLLSLIPLESTSRGQFQDQCFLGRLWPSELTCCLVWNMTGAHKLHVSPEYRYFRPSNSMDQTVQMCPTSLFLMHLLLCGIRVSGATCCSRDSLAWHFLSPPPPLPGHWWGTVCSLPYTTQPPTFPFHVPGQGRAITVPSFL